MIVRWAIVTSGNVFSSDKKKNRIFFWERERCHSAFKGIRSFKTNSFSLKNQGSVSYPLKLPQKFHNMLLFLHFYNFPQTSVPIIKSDGRTFPWIFTGRWWQPLTITYVHTRYHFFKKAGSGWWSHSCFVDLTVPPGWQLCEQGHWQAMGSTHVQVNGLLVCGRTTFSRLETRSFSLENPIIDIPVWQMES